MRSATWGFLGDAIYGALLPSLNVVALEPTFPFGTLCGCVHVQPGQMSTKPHIKFLLDNFTSFLSIKYSERVWTIYGE